MKNYLDKKAKRYTFKPKKKNGTSVPQKPEVPVITEKDVLRKFVSSLGTPPKELYVLGDIIPRDVNAIAVVGSRKLTSYGFEVCKYLAGGVAAAGVTIVSGLMYGADICAHEAALARGGRTIAVLGYGFEYLLSNAYAMKIAKQILATSSGAVVSEYPPDHPPSGWTFPRRNKLVAAFSKGVLVVEAGEKSGSIITAGYAAKQSKEIYAIPGSIFSNVSRGKHKLIKDGAALVDSPDDILIALGMTTKGKKRGVPNLVGFEKELYDLLEFESAPLSVDFILQQTGKPVVEVNAALTALEINGLVKMVSSGAWSSVY